VLRTTPDPVPAADELETEIVTTEGEAFAATAEMTLTLSVLLIVTFWRGELDTALDAPWLFEAAHEATPAPETPPTRAPTARAATIPTVLNERFGSAGATGADV
jgi:hypothetical protein